MPDRIRFRLAIVGLSLLAATGLVAATSHARAPAAPDSVTATTVLVTPGAAYAAGRVHRALFGAERTGLYVRSGFLC